MDLYSLIELTQNIGFRIDAQWGGSDSTHGLVVYSVMVAFVILTVIFDKKR